MGKIHKKATIRRRTTPSGHLIFSHKPKPSNSNLTSRKVKGGYIVVHKPNKKRKR